MIQSEKDFLSLLGWNGFFESSFFASDFNNLWPARVIAEEKGLYRVQRSMRTAQWASLCGKMVYEAKGRTDYPAVGDWVLIDCIENENRSVIPGTGCPYE
jgi:ribosome biogenesis GTPase